MFTTIHSISLINKKTQETTVGVEVTKGIGIHISGLEDMAAKESLLRTATALQFQGFRIPSKKININISPAKIRRDNELDLAMAIAIIAASEQKNLPLLDQYLVIGELGLMGKVRTTSDINEKLKAAKGEKCIISINAIDTVKSQWDDTVYAVKDLHDALEILSGECDPDKFLIRNLRHQ